MFECCFPLRCKSGVHGSDQNVAFKVFLRSSYLMQIQKCIHIQGLSNFLFLNPFFVHIFLTVCLCCYFHFWMKLFSMLRSSSVMFQVPHLPLHHNTISANTHTSLLRLLHPVSFHSAIILSHSFYTRLPSINTSPVQPTFPFSLWHKTDWGWLVLSWLLRFSTGNSAAGVGGGAGSSSGARPAQGQEAGSSIPTKPAGGWTCWWPSRASILPDVC